MNTKTVELGGAQNYRRHQRDGQNLNEIDSQPVLPHQLVGWTPGEIDGTQIFSGPGPDIRQL